MKASRFRKVTSRADATFYEGERLLAKGLAKVSPLHWVAEAVPHTLTGGTQGHVIRITPKNPTKSVKYYIAEVQPRPKKKKPIFDED